MKFSIGYNPHYSYYKQSFSDLVNKYSQVQEVFYPFPHEISGRPPVRIFDQSGRDITLSIFVSDLQALRKSGKKLNLLLNGNCYGQSAISQQLLDHIAQILEVSEKHKIFPDIVTTTSIFIAKFLKRSFPSIELRASVTMDIHELQGMKYLTDFFDGYYLSLTRQRDIQFVEKANSWCLMNDKKLCLLPNSSCLGNCPFTAYHSNLVSHDTMKINRSLEDNIPCLSVLQKYGMTEQLKAVWIRPEDIHNYEGHCYLMKLTTRVHQDPKLVLDAYTGQKYDGDLLKILDPYYGIFEKYYVDNSKFPSSWFKQTSSCHHECCNCQYCNKVSKMILSERRA